MEEGGSYKSSSQVNEKQSTPTSNGEMSSRKGRKRQWKDLSTDPLKDGFEQYKATVVTGRTAIRWTTLSPGALFSRSQDGTNLHCKIDASKAVCLDTGDDLEIAPVYRETLEIWKVTSFNSTTVSKADF